MKSSTKQYFRERITKEQYALMRKPMVVKVRRKGYTYSLFSQSLKEELKVIIKIKSKFKQLGL